MGKKHTFHRENCDCLVRDFIIDIYGRKIFLTGQHAFEWSITICTKDTIVKMTYRNGKEARKRFYELKKKR